MRKITKIIYLLAVTIIPLAMIGCGGDEQAADTTNIDTDVTVGEAETQARKTSAKRSTSTGAGDTGSNPAVKSAIAKVEAALDAGNYTAAVDIVLKTKMDPSDQRVAYGMVTDEVTRAMATGDANATKAYQTMNQVRLMRQQSGR